MRHFLVGFVLFYIKTFAKLSLRINKPYVIGVAGSVGKSSARNALFAMIKDYFPTKVIRGNSETGIPLGILGIPPKNYGIFDWAKIIIKVPFGISYIKNVKYLVVEMGIDDPFPPKNMEYLLTIVKPDISISLNVFATHTMQFEKLLPQKPDEVSRHDFLLEKIAEEDTKIITKSGAEIGIYNKDNSFVANAIGKIRTNTKLYTFGEEKSTDIYYEKYEVSLSKTTYSYIIKETGKKITLVFNNYVLPKESREIFAAAILVGLSINLSITQIKNGLEKNFYFPKGRGSIFEGIKSTVIIDSSYNASKPSVIALLSLAQNLKNQTKRPLVFLFGDMRELGQEAEIEHLEVAKKIIECVDYLYCVGELTKEIVLPYVLKNGKLKQVEHFPNATRAGIFLRENLPEQALLLVKGSQNTIFLEEAIKFVLKNKKDKSRLCRQENYWLKKKELPVL